MRATVRAASKLEAKGRKGKLEHLARWLERDHPSAVACLSDGLAEMFTAIRLGLSTARRRCVDSTNLIDSSHSGIRHKPWRLTN